MLTSSKHYCERSQHCCPLWQNLVGKPDIPFHSTSVSLENTFSFSGQFFHLQNGDKAQSVHHLELLVTSVMLHGRKVTSLLLCWRQQYYSQSYFYRSPAESRLKFCSSVKTCPLIFLFSGNQNTTVTQHVTVEVVEQCGAATRYVYRRHAAHSLRRLMG